MDGEIDLYYENREIEKNDMISDAESNDFQLTMSMLTPNAKDNKTSLTKKDYEIHELKQQSPALTDDEMFSEEYQNSGLNAIYNQINNIKFELFDNIMNEVHCLKNSVILWNYSGLVPILSNVIEWNKYANTEIDHLNQRIDSINKIVQRFVKMYKNGRLQYKKKCNQLNQTLEANEELQNQIDTITKQLSPQIQIQTEPKPKSNDTGIQVNTINTSDPNIDINSKPKPKLNDTGIQVNTSDPNINIIEENEQLKESKNKLENEVINLQMIIHRLQTEMENIQNHVSTNILNLNNENQQLKNQNMELINQIQQWQTKCQQLQQLVSIQQENNIKPNEEEINVQDDIECESDNITCYAVSIGDDCGEHNAELPTVTSQNDNFITEEDISNIESRRSSLIKRPNKYSILH